MDALEMTLLFDYYGDLLTERQRECFELRYGQDLSLGEIGQELGVSRQGVHDNLNRAEDILRKMESKTGCVSRDLQCRKSARHIVALAQTLMDHTDPNVSAAAEKILLEAKALEE